MVDKATTLPSFLEAGLYLSYMNYAATGEGVTSCLAVCTTAEGSRRVLMQRLPEYFHRGIVTTPIDTHANEDVQLMIQWIPLPARELLREVSQRSKRYFAEIHYNLAQLIGYALVISTTSRSPRQGASARFLPNWPLDVPVQN